MIYRVTGEQPVTIICSSPQFSPVTALHRPPPTETPAPDHLYLPSTQTQGRATQITEAARQLDNCFCAPDCQMILGAGEDTPRT